MSEPRRAAQQAHHPATLRLPAMFEYALGGILGRAAIGLALVAAGGLMLSRSDILWIIGGTPVILLGGLAALSNLAALLNRERRKIVLSEEGVEIRYGFSRRYYRFRDYSDYRIARLGVRRFLTALPVEVEQSLGQRAEHVRLTIHDRPAFLSPMPLLGAGAPATLLEWQSTLNDLRRAAIATADLAKPLGDEIENEAAGEARHTTHHGALWQAREQAGTRPTRLSLRRYVRGRYLLALVFVMLLLVPIAFTMAVRLGVVTICSAATGAGCFGVDPVLQQGVMIGAPLLAVLVFVLGNARLTVRRAHDLDEDLSHWQAAFDLFSRDRTLRWRLGRETGTAGTNRFGPMPPE